MIRRLGASLLFVLTFLGLGAVGYWMLFSYFPGYDDEGYILLSARNYSSHGALYDSVYSQYGPAFYDLTDLFRRIVRSSIDNSSARLLTLTLWLGTAAACAGLVGRQTGVRSLALFTLTGTFLYLYYLPGEPFHPSTLIVFILAASAWIIAELLNANRLSGAVVVAGATGAFLFLTKINVGIFYVAGVGAWGLVNAAPERARRATAAVVGLVLLVLAATLMNSLWRETWVQIYFALFAIGAVGLLSVMRGEAVLKWSHAAWFAASGGLAALAVLSPVWLRGTSAAGLLEGVLLSPLRHPASYAYPVAWRPGSLVLAGLSLAVALAQPWICRRFSTATADGVVVALRLAQTLALAAGFVLLVNFQVTGAVFTYLAPLIWTWVISLHGVVQPRAARLGRGLLATVLLLQYLQAYPIGGSQESWGTFLFIPLVALGLAEIHRWNLAREPRPVFAARWWPAFPIALVAILTAKAVSIGRTSRADYTAFAELGLPGASQLHLPEATRTAYRILCLNAAVHADMLFSLPGMYSFNLWTELPTPTERNATLWFTLLTDEEQRDIVQSVERSPRPCLIVQESLTAMLRQANTPIQGVLRDYLSRNFSPVFNLEGFVFLVRNGRSIAPLNVARLVSREKSEPAAPLDLLDFRLAGDGTPIAAIEARNFASSQLIPLILNGTNAQVTTIAIDSADHVVGVPAEVSWPLHLTGLAHISVRFDRGTNPLPPLTTVFYLKAADGQVLGEVRIPE